MQGHLSSVPDLLHKQIIDRKIIIYAIIPHNKTNNYRKTRIKEILMHDSCKISSSANLHSCAHSINPLVFGRGRWKSGAPVISMSYPCQIWRNVNFNKVHFNISIFSVT
jgi:hypothetical protein